MRKLGVFGAAMVAVLTGAGVPHAQTPTTNQRVWTGHWEEHDAWQGRSVVGRSQAQLDYVYVQGVDEFGMPRWNSRRLTWSAQWEETRFDQLVIAPIGAADERGTIQNRYPANIVTMCTSSGSLELGPAVQGSGDELTPEQKAQLRGTRVTTYHPLDPSAPTPPPTSAGTCDLVQVLGMPNEDEFTGCGYEKAWPKGGRPAGSFSVSVSAPVTAVMDVDPNSEYGRFVPAPGQTLTFTARVPAGVARFRFELDPVATSHFSGYATNATVDDEMFFLVHDLTHLQDQYRNDGPDFLFDSSRFDRQAWSRVEPLVVETATPQAAAVVTVTAMDYGAVGKLRAFVKSEDCGGWLPIPVRLGAESREAVAIPMDEDHNLMADALEGYEGDPGRDEDAEPPGNGFTGDGFTAFEEYRGFMAGPGCRYGDPRLTLWHRRTMPDHKDLLVAINARDLQLAPGLRLFEYATDLHVLSICDQHMIDGATGGLNNGVNTPQSRVVNFTLQQQGLRVWNGHRISQEPQRGISIRTFRSYCQDGACNYGFAHPVDEQRIGPPKLTQFVTINDGITAAEMAVTVVHEIGHAVGIPHHSEDIGPDWRIQYGRLNVTGRTSPYQRQSDLFPVEAASMAPVDGLLVDPGSTCSDRSTNARYANGRFVGCYTTRIVRRGEQNSGDFYCPIRYRFGSNSHYEPPGVTARFLSTRSLDTNDGDKPVTVDHWSGALVPYDMSRESVTDVRSFCTTAEGTLINSGADRTNHSGDARRQKGCRAYIVVNDRAVRDGS